MHSFVQSLPLRWLIAVISFPIGGFIGHLVAGPAATIPSALISGAIAGGIIGLGQGFALKLRSQALVLWAGATAAGLALALAAVTAVIGQITNSTEAAALVPSPVSRWAPVRRSCCFALACRLPGCGSRQLGWRGPPDGSSPPAPALRSRQVGRSMA